MTSRGRIGMDSLAVSNKHYRYCSFEHFLGTQRRLGIKKIELWGGTPHIRIDAYKDEDGKGMKGLVSGYGLEVAAFMPEFSSFRYAPGIQEPDVHLGFMEYLRRCARYTALLESGCMLLGLDAWSLKGDFGAQWDCLLKTISGLGEIAAQEGIRVAVLTGMPHGRNLIDSNERLRSCLNTVNSPCIYPALDLSAMYMAAESAEMWMETWKERLEYVHIVDQDGDTFSGDGRVDDNSLLETLKILEEGGYRGSVGVMAENGESFAEPEGWDQKAMGYFKRFFGNGN